MNIRLIAQSIASGHAFEKHVVQRKEFPGIATPEEFAEYIEKIMSRPSRNIYPMIGSPIGTKPAKH